MPFVKRGVDHRPRRFMIHLDTNFLIQISVAGSAAHAQVIGFTEAAKNRFAKPLASPGRLT